MSALTPTASGVVILAGRGSRMRLSPEIQKCALDVGDRPLFAYLLEQFLRLPLCRISLVLGSGADHAWSVHRRMVDKRSEPLPVPIGVHHDRDAHGSASSVRVAVAANDNAVLYGTPTAAVSLRAWRTVLERHDPVRFDATLIASRDPEIAGHPVVVAGHDDVAASIAPAASDRSAGAWRLVGGGLLSGRVIGEMSGSMSAWLGRHLADHPGRVQVVRASRVMHFATPADFEARRSGQLLELTR